MNVLLIGIDYFAHRGSSDKNFWYQMMPILRANLEQLQVISFNYRPVAQESQVTPGGDVRVLNVRPAHVGIDLRPDPSTVYNRDKCHAHFKTPPLSPLEYLWSFLRLRPFIKHLIDKQRITNIHCLDNFGPAMHLLRRWSAPIPVSVSAMGYYARGPLHDRYLQLSFRGLDKIVPFSDAYCQKLISLGLPKESLQTIRWGVELKALGGPVSLDERCSLKRDLGIDPQNTLVFWTGFIQQIKERELLSSLQIARDVTKRIENVNFVFALKPECYKPDHQSLAAPRIRLSATSNKVFLRSLRAADYLLSPVTNTDSIITPPLTWLEAMAIGVPIVTNRVPGVEAVIQSGINGFVAESIASISDLFDLVISQENRDAMRENARAHVLTSYRVDRSAAEYQALWRTLLERR